MSNLPSQIQTNYMGKEWLTPEWPPLVLVANVADLVLRLNLFCVPYRRLDP